MKKSRKLIVITVITLAILLIMATPAMADRRTLACGGAPECRINVYLGTPDTYPADAPFYITHSTGDSTNHPPIAAGLMGFALEVDGKYVESAWDFKLGVGARVDPPPNVIWSGSVFDFPQGLPAGPHTFTGHWFEACLPQYGCEPPVRQVDYAIVELTVTFK